MRRVAVPREGRKYVETKEEWQSPGERVRDKSRQCTYSLTLIRVHVTIVAVAKKCVKYS